MSASAALSFLHFGSGRDSTENKELLLFLHKRWIQHQQLNELSFRKPKNLTYWEPGAGKPEFLPVSLREGGREGLIFLQHLFS